VAEVLGGTLDAGDDLGVLGQCGEPVGAEGTQQLYRVVPDLFPDPRLEAAEQLL
jgi:hypothetical protein